MSHRGGKAIEPLSRQYLLSRGKCCGNGCENCPWIKTMKVVSLDINTTILQGKDQWRDDLRGEWRSVPPSLFGKLAKDVLPRCSSVRGYDARLSNAVHPSRWKKVYGVTKP